MSRSVARDCPYFFLADSRRYTGKPRGTSTCIRANADLDEKAGQFDIANTSRQLFLARVRADRDAQIHEFPSESVESTAPVPSPIPSHGSAKHTDRTAPNPRRVESAARNGVKVVNSENGVLGGRRNDRRATRKSFSSQRRSVRRRRTVDLATSATLFHCILYGTHAPQATQIGVPPLQPTSPSVSQTSVSGQTAPSPHTEPVPGPEQVASHVPHASAKPSSQVSVSGQTTPSPHAEPEPAPEQVASHVPQASAKPSSQASLAVAL